MLKFCIISFAVFAIITYIMAWALCQAAARADRAIDEMRDEKTV